MAPIGARVAFHLPEQSVLAIIVTQNGMISSCNESTRFTAQYWTDHFIHDINNTYLSYELRFMSAIVRKEYSVNQFKALCL